MLELLRAEGIPHELVASKCDTVRSPDELRQSLSSIRSVLTYDEGGRPINSALALGEIVAVGHVGDGRKNDHVKPSMMRGVAELQWALLRATGLEGYAMQRLFGVEKTNAVTTATTERESTAQRTVEQNPRRGRQIGGLAELISTSAAQIRDRRLSTA